MSILTRNPAINLIGRTPSQLEDAEASLEFQSGRVGRGVGGGHLVDPNPRFVKAHTERVISNQHNASIVLGRDRPGSRLSGYGGSGDTHCGTLDLVVGRMASNARTVDDNGDLVYVDPNFRIDSARIYISQKTDIDGNFGITSGRVGQAVARSAVGIKADAVRVVAREGIKLVTRTDAKNSQGGDITAISGIDLIAGNDDSDLQPFVKGSNMVEAMQRLTAHLGKLTGIVESFIAKQSKFNEEVQSHTHISPFFGSPTSPSISLLAYAGPLYAIQTGAIVQPSLDLHRVNLESFKATYLEPTGGKYINSRFNNVN